MCIRDRWSSSTTSTPGNSTPTAPTCPCRGSTASRRSVRKTTSWPPRRPGCNHPSDRRPRRTAGTESAAARWVTRGREEVAGRPRWHEPLVQVGEFSRTTDETPGPLCLGSPPVPPATRSGRVVLGFGHVLRPDYVFAVLARPLNCEVNHREPGRGAVPMPLPGFDQHRVAGLHRADWLPRSLHPPHAGQDVQHLAERMRMPGRARTWFEGDPDNAHAGRRRGHRDLIQPDRPGEIFGGRLDGG